MTSEARSTTDIVVVHYNAPEALAQCVEPLLNQSAASSSWTLTVVDNDAQNPAAAVGAQLDEKPWARYLTMQDNIGFGAASNKGARQGASPYVLFLNPDCVIAPTSIATLEEVLDQDPGVVAVGPRIERPNGDPELSWAEHPGFLWEIRRRRLWKALRARKSWALSRAIELLSTARDVDWLTGACLMVRRDAFEAIDGFDEEFFLYFEDADLGVRLAEHGTLRFCPEAQAQHQGGASAPAGETASLPHYRRSQKLYYAKHRPAWERAALALWRMVKP